MKVELPDQFPIDSDALERRLVALERPREDPVEPGPLDFMHEDSMFTSLGNQTRAGDNAWHDVAAASLSFTKIGSSAESWLHCHYSLSSWVDAANFYVGTRLMFGATAQAGNISFYFNQAQLHLTHIAPWVKGPALGPGTLTVKLQWLANGVMNMKTDAYDHFSLCVREVPY